MSEIRWLEGQPYSLLYGDVYFSRHSGIAETRHVFLHHNRLPERFAALEPDGVFVIGETGFGTGLNFLCAWQEWQRSAPPSARLHFVSCEKHPLSHGDLERALALWPELEALSRELLGRYRHLAAGWNRLVLADGQVSLTLLVGDALETLPRCQMAADAWFLDGFAPARNPALWRPALFRAMARLSKPWATFATFTAAGEVRRGLLEAGFAVEKVAGFGRKRDMLRGELTAPPEAKWRPPWYAPPPPVKTGTAAVIGGGIAGASTAAALARRGWDVTLIERHEKLAREGSGNPQGILYAKLSPHPTPLTQLTLAGYGHTLRLLDGLLPEDPALRQSCGVLQLAYDHAEDRRLAQLAGAGSGEGLMRLLGREQASALAGIELPAGGLFFPHGGWVHPPAVVEALAAGVRVMTGRAVTELRREADGWQIGGGGETLRADVVVLAQAGDSAAFPATAYLPLHKNRGQVTVVPATETSRRLSTVLCGESYITPARGDGTHTLGATYAPFGGELAVTRADCETNLGHLKDLAPALHAALDADRLDPAALPGRASLRAVTADHLPVVGPVVDAAAFNAVYARLARDAKLKLTDPAPWLPGLYVNAAHGSRGLLTAPLCGEALACLVAGEPSPLPAPVLAALHPSRFLARALARGKPSPV